MDPNDGNINNEEGFRDYSEKTGEEKNLNNETKDSDINNSKNENQENSNDNDSQIDQNKLNSIVGKAKEQAVKSFLKKNGFENKDDLMSKLEEYNKLQNENMSETERIKKQYEELNKKYNEAIKNSEENETRYTALKLNINPSHVDKVVKLSNTYSGDTSEERIQAVIKDFPELTRKVNTEMNVTDRSNNQNEHKIDKDKETFNRIFGLK